MPPRDPSAAARYLAKVLLHIRLNKDLQTSGFSGNSLTLDQLRYIAIDGAVSLEAFEKMEEMPDVIKHLEKGDLTLDKKVR